MVLSQAAVEAARPVTWSQREMLYIYLLPLNGEDRFIKGRETTTARKKRFLKLLKTKQYCFNFKTKLVTHTAQVSTSDCSARSEVSRPHFPCGGLLWRVIDNS